MIIASSQQVILRHLWFNGPLSRSELHGLIGMTPNAVGAEVIQLQRLGLVKELAPKVSSGGRPQIPLILDPSARRILGISIEPGQVAVTELGLNGQLTLAPIAKSIIQESRLVTAAAYLAKEHCVRRTLLAAVSVTGLIDHLTGNILLSSSAPHHSHLDTSVLRKELDDVELIIANDLHAAAGRWAVTHRSELQEDTLLIAFDDGRIGSVMVINGRPNQGCIMGANELGHTRFPVKTDRCFCGQIGCLERIFSSSFLGPTVLETDFTKRVETPDTQDVRLMEMLNLLVMAFANAVNFVRPARLVLASRFMGNKAFADWLTGRIRQAILPQLSERVAIDTWNIKVAGSAESAAWLGLASLLFEPWNIYSATARTVRNPPIV
ncbi:MAG: ROK family protein [Phycisphaerae bacterium]